MTLDLVTLDLDDAVANARRVGTTGVNR